MQKCFCIMLSVFLLSTTLFPQTMTEAAADKLASNSLLINLSEAADDKIASQNSLPHFRLPSGGVGYGFTYLGNSLVRFPITPPLTPTTIASVPFGGGADFDNAGNLYLIQWNGIDQLSIVDTTNGAMTVIGPSTVLSGHLWSGLAYDPTSSIFYGASTTGVESAIYTIDPGTGAATWIATNGNLPSVAGIEIDQNGQMYAHSLNSDAIYLVDKTTGAETLLGAVGQTGVSPGHDLSFDPASGELYLVVSRVGNVADLFTINLANGNGTLVGSLPAGTFPAGFAISGEFADPLDPTPPLTFSAYSDYTTPNSMSLQWTDPSTYNSGAPLTDFTIEVYRDGAFAASVPMGNEAYTDAGLNDGQQYHYEIFAKDLNDSLSTSALASWIAGGAGQPLPPENFSIGDPGGGQLTAQWVNPRHNIDGTPLDDLAEINLYESGALLATFSVASGDTGLAAMGTFTPGPGTHAYFLTAVDNESPPNESGISNPGYAPLSLPIFDDFANTGVPDQALWLNEDAEVNALGVNPISPPNVLSLDGFPHSAATLADVVTIFPVELSGMDGQNVQLSFWYQPEGTGNAPEAVDSLQVEFRNNLGEWKQVRIWPGGPLVPFINEVIEIAAEDPGPGATFFHSGFQFRFRNYATPSTTTPFDHWLVDDVSLALLAPAISVSSDSLAFGDIAAGSSAQMPLQIYNHGADTLRISSISASDNAFSADASNIAIAPADSQTVNVSFSPTQAGDYSSSLHIISNDPVNDTLGIALNGSAFTLTGWIPVNSGTTSHLNAVHFLSPEVGYVVGNGGTTLHTTDGGASWTSQVSDTPENLQSVYFVNESTGYTAGSGGLILKTTNGGQTWQGLNTGTTVPLYDITFTDELNGYAVGLGAEIIITRDGGASWNPPNTGASFGLFAVSFGDSSNGFAVGNNGVIYRSTDSGNNWSLLQSGSPNDLLLGVDFIDGQSGIACGDFGRILRTSDGGATWDEQNVTSDLLYSVDMIDGQNAYICGAPGIILNSTDGGANWTMEASGTGASLFDVHFPDPTTGYICGTGGTILKKTISAPAISVSPTAVNFDTVGVGSLVQDTLTIHNPGTADLVVSDIFASDSTITIMPNSATIAPANSQSIAISFTPMQPGAYHETVYIASNAPGMDTMSVPVNGFVDDTTAITTSSELPKTYALYANYPNPFNPETKIRYQLPQASQVTLTIYNVLGQKIRSLLNTRISAGSHEIVWDGRDDFGEIATSGIYFYRFQAGEFLQVRKMLLVR